LQFPTIIPYFFYCHFQKKRKLKTNEHDCTTLGEEGDFGITRKKELESRKTVGNVYDFLSSSSA
jgi:hypothetical protein